jgi:L-ascorbate metabolism protein UlaG (beta-lactamase superfamily)
LISNRNTDLIGSLTYAIFRLMDITWLGHSCFKLKGSHTTVITDPYSPELGYSLGKPNARIVTVSHQHPGHSYVQGVGNQPKVIKGPGEYEISGVLILGIATFHDGERGKKRGKNTVYLVEIDEVAVCHLGDLGHVLTGEQVEEIDNVDVLLLPVGGVSTINAPMAAEIVRQLEPKVVIPMHYQTPALSGELEPVDRFLKEIGAKQVNSQPKLSLTKSNLPASMQVFLLDYPH